MATLNRFRSVWNAIKAAPAAAAGGTVMSTVSAMFNTKTYAFQGQTNIPFIEAVNQGYRGLVWVYRCIKEIGEAVGSVNWVVAKRMRDGSLEYIRDPKHPLKVLLDQPNQFQDSAEFFEAWAIYLSLSGNAYWNVIAVGNPQRPFQLFHVRPDWMCPIPDPVTFISGYQLDNKAGVKKTYKPNEVLHFKYLDPTDPYVGMSPLTALRRTMQTENSAITWNKTIFDNMAVPGGVLTVPAQVMTIETRDRLQEDLQAQFSGENKDKPLILWGGMDWKQMGMNVKDLDFASLKTINKFEICAGLGVPPGIVGANEDPTYSNIGVERMAFWEDTIITMVSWLQRRLNRSVAPAFGEDLVILADYSHVPAMREIMTQKVGQAKVLVNMGFPLNAVNQKLNLGFDAVPWGDVWWAPMNMAPISGPEAAILADPNSPPPPSDPGRPEDDEGEIEEPEDDEGAVSDPEDPSKGKRKKKKDKSNG